MKKFTRPRLVGTLLVTIILMVVINFIAPQQLPVSLYKISLVTTAGVVGYYIDREVFPYARPDAFLTDKLINTNAVLLYAVAQLRRAVLIAASMLAIGLGA